MSRPRKGAKSERLAGTFSGIVRDKNWQQKFDQYQIFPKWKQLVDSDTAAHSRPLKVVKDVLWLEVDNSAWMQQLQFQKIFLLETLNDQLSVSRFSDIRFKLQEKEPQEPVDKTPQIRFITPPPGEVEAFREQISSITDETIRESLMRLWYLSRACRRQAPE